MDKLNCNSTGLNKTAFGSKVQDDAQATPAPSNEGGTVTTHATALQQTSEDPRLVIRGENPVSLSENSFAPFNPKAAIVDWLNFTFLYNVFECSALLELDTKFKQAFGFGLRANRFRKHLNYDHSWELGNNFGIFAYGGSSVGGTAFFSISSTGCTATKDWTAVSKLLNELSANITRIDLAHDDFNGLRNVQTALEMFQKGDFNSIHGRPANPKLIDDFDTGNGKTFYVGSRKNGKMLRVYEKGKQLGDPDSLWVRWELELHNQSYVIPNIAVLLPGLYLAGSYPCLKWISTDQLHFESIKQTQSISLAVLIHSCRNSYGKLLWVMKNVLGYTSDEIIEKLAKEGIPARMNLPVVGGGDVL